MRLDPLGKLLDQAEVNAKNSVIEAYNLGLQKAADVLKVFACNKTERKLLKQYNASILRHQIEGRYEIAWKYRQHEKTKRKSAK